MNRRAATLSLVAGIAFALTLHSLSAAADAQCKLVLVEEWKVRWVNNHIIIDGAINGQPVGVMLDTGAQRTLIFRSAAARLGLTTHWARGYTMSGVGGQTDVESAYI